LRKSLIIDQNFGKILPNSLPFLPPMAYLNGKPFLPFWKNTYLFIYLPILPIFPFLPAVELQPERPEGNRRRAKLHLGKNYFFENSF